MTSDRTIVRDIPADPQTVWDLWTTTEGIQRWWAPDGFRTDVSAITLEEGGELVYTLTAVDPDQVRFMEQNGLPRSSQSRKRFTEIDAPNHLAYTSVVDFVPGREPYEHLTVVDLDPVDEGTRVTMTIEPMHDAEWTERLAVGRSNELETWSP